MSDPSAAPQAPLPVTLMSAADSTPTGTLSITTEPPLLAITVYDHDINIVAKAVSPVRVRLPPGLYMVRASLVGRQDLSQFAWVLSNSDRSVKLSTEGQTLLEGATQGVSGLIDRFVRKVPQFDTLTSVAPAPVSVASAREQYWLRFLRLKDWNTAEPVDLPAFSGVREGEWDVLEITNPHPAAVFVQVARPDERTVNVALPPGSALRPARCYLVVNSKPGLLEAHVRLATGWANSALQYMAQGQFEEARQLVEVAGRDRPSKLAQFGQRVADRLSDPAKKPWLVGNMIQHFVNRFEDPTAELIPRYLGLRLREKDVFNVKGDFLFDIFQGIPDGLVISAVLAARERMYKTAAQRLLSIPDGGLTLFSEGFSILIHLTKELTELDDGKACADQTIDEEQTEKLKALQRALFKWAPFVNISSPTLTFRGNDIVAPRQAEVPQTPSVKDGWISAPSL